ncbi:MAG: hypothetical protein IK078_02970 [Lachnospiraceae bacterium]|nr:hypothetical protein [Lachnospiraceae bacterium]
MSLFTSAQEKQILAIIKRVEMNASNNYKDAAQAAIADLEKALADPAVGGKLKDKKKAEFDSLLADYKARYQGFTHKDQKPYWT